MTVLRSLEDIATLTETRHIECKLAQGRDGNGALPEDIWETYSAFANTGGGDIFLGLRELGPGNYQLAGIPNSQKVIDELMEGANDKRQVNINLLCIDNVQIINIAGLTIIHVHIPRAPATLKPVYINGEPLTGSYIREGEADIRLNADQVRRIQAKVRAELLGKS